MIESARLLQGVLLRGPAANGVGPGFLAIRVKTRVARERAQTFLLAHSHRRDLQGYTLHVSALPVGVVLLCFVAPAPARAFEPPCAGAALFPPCVAGLSAVSEPSTLPRRRWFATLEFLMISLFLAGCNGGSQESVACAALLAEPTPLAPFVLLHHLPPGNRASSHRRRLVQSLSAYARACGNNPAFQGPAGPRRLGSSPE